MNTSESYEKQKEITRLGYTIPDIDEFTLEEAMDTMYMEHSNDYSLIDFTKNDIKEIGLAKIYARKIRGFEPSDELLEYILNYNGEYLKYIEDQTDEMINHALFSDVIGLLFIKNPQRKYMDMALSNSSIMNEDVISNTWGDDIYDIALKYDCPEILYYHKDIDLILTERPDEEIEHLLNLDGNLIEHVENPTNEMKLIAVK